MPTLEWAFKKKLIDVNNIIGEGGLNTLPYIPLPWPLPLSILILYGTIQVKGSLKMFGHPLLLDLSVCLSVSHGGFTHELCYNSGHINNPFSPLFYPQRLDFLTPFHSMWPRIDIQSILKPHPIVVGSWLSTVEFCNQNKFLPFSIFSFFPLKGLFHRCGFWGCVMFYWRFFIIFDKILIYN